MPKNVSIKDIAKRVGVSTALVSYVLNGLEKEKRVGAELAAKIHEVAKEMSYKPNQIARSLRKGSTNTIGLIVADISNPFFGQLAKVIENEATKFGYTVILGSSDENCLKSTSLVETFLNRQVDGLIITPSEGCNKSIEAIVNQGIPLVLMDRYYPNISVNHVILNNYAATHNAVNCFVSKEYKRIALIAYRSELVHMQERIRGYQEAMQLNGLENEILIKRVRYENVFSDIKKEMTELINSNKIEAILFATNALSINGLYYIRNNGINIPKDIAVIGFDGHEVFDFYQPQLTYIQQPLEEMGKESTKILVEQINGSNKIVRVELKHQLIERESCG